MERTNVKCRCGVTHVARTNGCRCVLCREWYARQRLAGIPHGKRIERADLMKLKAAGQDVSELIAMVYANDGVS